MFLTGSFFEKISTITAIDKKWIKVLLYVTVLYNTVIFQKECGKLSEEKKTLESNLHHPDLTLPADDIEIKKFKTKFVHFLTDTDILEIREFLKTVIVSITLDNDGVDVKLEV